MDRAYLDNAATSFPKAPGVVDAITSYMTEVGASPGRGAYAESVEGGRIIADCRKRLAALVNCRPAEGVIFTLNATDALNLAIKGMVSHRMRTQPGRPIRLVTTQMDHNSVLRPFNALGRLPGVEWVCLDVDPQTGALDPEDLDSALTPDTLLVAVVHASNVTGALQPIADCASICRRAGVPILVDAAQTIGHTPIDMDATGIDLLAFPGHKGLLGPLGTGALAISRGMEDRIDPLRDGGTGSKSEDDRQPGNLPDKFEPGSHNTPGIAGLREAIRWVESRGIGAIHAHIRALVEQTLERLPALEDLGYRFPGPRGADQRVGVFSFTHDAIAPHELAMILETAFGVLVRAGIHCAPRAHDACGTLRATHPGACRMSYSVFTTPDQVDRALDALEAIAREVVRHPAGKPFAIA